MRLRLEVGADPDEIDLLREWLAEAGVRDLRFGQSDDPAHQGVDIQVLSVAISTTLTVANLVLQVANWRRTRPRQPVVTVTQELPNGVVMRIDSFDTATLAEAARKLEGG